MKKNGKRMLSILLATIMVFAMITVAAPAALAGSSGDFTFNVSNGNATITKYTGTGGAVTIPGTVSGYPVTAINGDAFYGCTGLTSLTIPSGVTNIGISAFANCSGLTNMTIASSVTSIGNEAFSGCTGLTSVTIPDSVTSIGDYAFSGCTGLTSVTIPNGVTIIGGGAFDDCMGLTQIIVDANNLSYASQDGVLFNKDKSTLIQYPGGKTGGYIIPSSVTDGYSFTGCTELSGVTIPSNSTSADFETFSGCTKLASVTFLSGVTSIDYYMFEGCTALTSVTIPDSVTDISQYSFEGCSGFTIYASSSSYAREYAANYNIPFVVNADSSTSSQAGSAPASSQTDSSPVSAPTSTDNRIILGKDNNSFIHTDESFFGASNLAVAPKYYLSNDLYNQLVKGQPLSVKNLVKSEMDSKWVGSCQGLSTTIALAKVNDINIKNFDSAATSVFTMKKPADDTKVRDLIDYYQLAQSLPNIQASTITAFNPGWFDWLSTDQNKLDKLEAVLSHITDLAKKIKGGGDPFLITLEDSKEGHCVVASGCETLANGDYKIEICDPNATNIYTTSKYTTSKYIYMTISKDYSTWSITDANGTSDWDCIGYLELGSLSSIDIDGPNNSQSTQLPANESQINMGISSKISISDSTGNVFDYNDGGATGDLKPNSVSFVNSSTADGESNSDMILSFPESGAFNISPQDGHTEVSLLNSATYTDVSGDGITSLKFNEQNGVEILGSACSYTAYVSYISGVGCKLIKIAVQKGDDINITQSDKGILVKSDHLQGIDLTSFGDGTQSEATFSTSKNEILIKDNANGASGTVQVAVSSKDNGVFDQVIKVTGSTASPKTETAAISWFTVFLIVAVVLVVVAGLLILLYFLRKKRKPMPHHAIYSDFAAPATWICDCGMENKNEAAFCVNCGKRKHTPEPAAVNNDAAPATWMCICGTINKDDAIFCENCGDKKPTPSAI